MAVVPGTDLNDTLVGTLGRDLLFGEDGDDILRGLLDQDFLIGGEGSDSYFIRDSNAVVLEFAGEGTDTVYTTVDYTVLGSSEIEFLRAQGTADLTLSFENGQNDISITGNSGNNTLIGGHGNDFLFGRGGDDEMRGGAGDDRYIVTETGDTVFENAGEGFDTVIARADFTLGAGQEIEVLRGFSTTGLSLGGNELGNKIVGSIGNDMILGNAGKDELRGGAGQDILNGGAGDDFLHGGDGADSFIFTTGFGSDRIADFDFALGEQIIFAQVAGLTDASQLTLTAVAAGRNTLIEFDGSSVIVVGASATETLDSILVI